MWSEIEVNKDLYPLKSNFKGKRTVGKTNKVINAEEIMTCLKKLIHIKKGASKKKKEKKKGKLHRTAKVREAEVYNNNKMFDWKKVNGSKLN